MTADHSAHSLLRISHFARTLALLASSMLAVPALATAGIPGPTLDHFRVYPNSQAAGADGPVVQIDDQFGSQTTDLRLPIHFMVPVDKNEEGIFDFFSHLTCYQILDGSAGPAVIATNQFGVQPLTLGVPDSLCVPTEKLISPGLVNLDHYKCYVASGAPLDLGVGLQDQFGASGVTVLDPKLFCTPASKNQEPVLDPVTHLTCYSTSPPGVAPGQIPIQNQFIAEQGQLDLLEANMVCAPSTKQVVVPTPDEYMGYPASALDGVDPPVVQIDDQFGSQTTDLGLVRRFLVPVDKNDEGLTDDISHLTCYSITDGVAAPAVISTNQFGVQPLTLGRPDSLCVPTEKLISPGTVDLDHYKCYEASGAVVDATVGLVDQFQAGTGTVLEPRLFCTPASKNQEPIDDPDTHLTCYSLDLVGQPPGQVPISNQFTMMDQIDLAAADLLCAPSTKEVPPTAEHFTVYRTTGPDGPAVTMADQFGIQATDLGRVSLFMVPAVKNAETLFDAFTHLTCHTIDEVALPPNFEVSVTNQFGTDQPLKVGIPRELCAPTEKLIDPGPINGDHYRCWEALDPSGDGINVPVTLLDQFQGFTANVLDPFRICAPVDKNREGIQDPATHLVCYNLGPGSDIFGFQVPILNQFFPNSTNVVIEEAIALCAPSVKTVPEPALLLGLGSGLTLLMALERRRRRRQEDAD